LDHVSSLPVVGRGFKSGRDDHTVAIFMENESVQREPPWITVKTNIVASRFVGTGRISDESGKLHDGQVPGVGILNHGSDDTPATESPAGGTFREDLSGITDGIGADGAEAVATVESQFAPPMIASTSIQMTGRIRM
jgi:hypothetical protein